MNIQFTIPGVPAGKGRPRVTSHGTYTPQKTKDYETLAQFAYRGSRCAPFTDKERPLFYLIRAYFPVPKSYSAKKRVELFNALYLHKPDADNIEKAILDALNGLAYPDDNQVAAALCIKRYAEKGRADVLITDNVQEFISSAVEAIE